MGIVLICGANVAGRYFLGAAISWGEEAMMFLMVFVVFASSAAVPWHGLHMKLDVLLRRVTAVLRRFVVLATDDVLERTPPGAGMGKLDVVSTL